MRHRVAGKKLNRDTDSRKALRRNLIKQLFEHERIKTTQAKAVAVRGEAEKLITLAKNGNSAGEIGMINARRKAAAELSDSEAVKRLFDEIAPRFENRQGGYTRIIKLGPRKGDAAEMALLELIED
ncbi:MAG: 50S ribosomal protein L17 [Anaerolineales bacterium]|jgi:large subunit ribosomal protein L17